MWLMNWFKQRNQGQPLPEARLKILALGMFIQDRILLERLGKRHNWELRFTNSPPDAFQWVSQKEFEIILCDRNQHRLSLAGSDGSPREKFTAELHIINFAGQRRLFMARCSSMGRLRCPKAPFGSRSCAPFG